MLMKMNEKDLLTSVNIISLN